MHLYHNKRSDQSNRTVTGMVYPRIAAGQKITLLLCLCLCNNPTLAAPTPNPTHILLNTGAFMPYVNLGGTASSVKKGDHYSNYSAYLALGGRGLDTALTYTDGINRQMGAAIRTHPEIPRQDLFITTKVPCCPGTPYCLLPEYKGNISADMAKNNQLLGVDYTDITLLHHPCLTDELTILKYLELEQAMVQGHTKAIGVSNFDKRLLQKLINDERTTTVPAVNQCNHAIGNHNESHQPLAGGDDQTVEFCQQHSIVYSAYSPLEGLSGEDVFKIPKVVEMAKVHAVSPAQIALRWLIQQNITIVTAAHNASFLAEDLDVFGFELSGEEMQELSDI